MHARLISAFGASATQKDVVDKFVFKDWYMAMIMSNMASLNHLADNDVVKTHQLLHMINDSTHIKMQCVSSVDRSTTRHTWLVIDLVPLNVRAGH